MQIFGRKEKQVEPQEPFEQRRRVELKREIDALEIERAALGARIAEFRLANLVTTGDGQIAWRSEVLTNRDALEAEWRSMMAADDVLRARWSDTLRQWASLAA